MKTNSKKLSKWFIAYYIKSFDFNPILGKVWTNLKGPKKDSPQNFECICDQQKKNRVNHPKIGPVGPIFFFFKNGYSSKRQIFRNIRVATLKLP